MIFRDTIFDGLLAALLVGVVIATAVGQSTSSSPRPPAPCSELVTRWRDATVECHELAREAIELVKECNSRHASTQNNTGGNDDGSHCPGH